MNANKASIHLRLLAFICGLYCLAAGAEQTQPVDPVFTHPASAQELEQMLGTATQTLRQAAALRGEFSQRKFLHELPQPLNSSGDFLVARGLGVSWHTRAPFDSDLVLTPQALVQRDAGAEALRVDAATQPGLGAVAQVFDALFALDLPQLAQRFTLYGEPGKDGWILGLKPREAALAQAMSAVVVQGRSEPQRIELYEASGDRTEILFSHQAAVAALTDAERQHFK
jgi:hypothetical protein